MPKFCKEILHFCQHSIHSKGWLLLEESSTGQSTTVMLIWCLNKWQVLSLNFWQVDSFLQKNEFLNLYTVVLVSLLSGGCTDELVDNRENYQG